MQNNPERPNVNNAANQPDADYGEYTSRAPSGQPRTRAPQYQKKRRKKGGSNNLLKPILAIVGVVVAVVLLIVIVVALFSAPNKNVKLEDNAYYTYTDSDGTYHIVSNGKKVEHSFNGNVTLIPAKNYSFAYVFESVSDANKSGVNMYILKGTKLESIEGFADSIPTVYADYKPAFVYLEKDIYCYYSADGDQGPIVKKGTADNFVISNDGDVVVYTEASSVDPTYIDLKYFTRSGTEPTGLSNLTPVGLSTDGSYIYATGMTSDTGITSLYYLQVNKRSLETSSPVAITSASKHGSFRAITGMNANGKEIIFSVDDLSKGTVVSYRYKIKDTEPQMIAEGTFTPINTDKDTVCPDTFINTYFVCANNVAVDDEGGMSSMLATYVLEKKGARKVANTVGQFSPDEKYFYYVDEASNLVRVPLNSKDFARDEKNIVNAVADFAVVDKGDVYAMLLSQEISFWDASTGQRKRIIFNADLDSMRVCGNTVFASISDKEVGTTVVYSSTGGSSKEEASFKDTELAQSPTIIMGGGTAGYALVKDTNDSLRLYYTSNGKKFTFVSSCGDTAPNSGTESAPKETEEE